MQELSNDQFWNLLTGALGPEKVAYLRYAPLDIVVGNYVQSKTGADYGGQFTLMDGLSYAVAQQRQADEEFREIQEAIKLAELLGVAPEEPRGDSLVTKLADVAKLAKMELAMPDVAEKLASLRADIEDEIIDSLYDAFATTDKTAGIGQQVSNAVSAARDAMPAGLPGQAARGAALGAGAAVPLYAAGNHLADKKIEDAKSTALTTAAGAAALVGGGALLGGALANKTAATQSLAIALFIDQLTDKTAAHGTYRMNRAVAVSALADMLS